MTRHQIALRISRKIYTGKLLKKKFNAYQLIQAYFAHLSLVELISVAGSYGIEFNHGETS